MPYGIGTNSPCLASPRYYLERNKIVDKRARSISKKEDRCHRSLPPWIRHAYNSGFGIPKVIIERLEEEIGFLRSTIEIIGQQLSALVEQQKELRQTIDRITKVTGLGTISVLTVLAGTNNFSLVNNIEQLVSYAGLDVQLNQSGKTGKRARISKKGQRGNGNPHIRKALYMPALSASNCKNASLNEFYERVIEKNLAKK